MKKSTFNMVTKQNMKSNQKTTTNQLKNLTQPKFSYGVIKEVAERLNLNRSAVQMRIKRMNDAEVLKLAAEIETNKKNKIQDALKEVKKATTMSIIPKNFNLFGGNYAN